MARARVARGRFIRPAQKTKMWIGSGIGLTVLTGATKTLLATLSASALLLRPFTILRTRMFLLWSTDQEAADETPHGSYGHIVVTDTAAAIGATAVPNPSGIDGDPEGDWYVWQALASKVLVDTVSGVHGAQGLGFVIDSSAMRKVGPDDDIATVVDVQTAQGAALVTNGRMLVQLH